MKKARNTLGGILIFLGVPFIAGSLYLLWAILTGSEAEGRLTVVVSSVMLLILSLGMLYGGFRLRNPKAKARSGQNAGLSKADTAHKAPEPKRFSPEEKAERRQRQKKEQEEREQRQRDYDKVIEEGKKAREAFYEPWKNTDPDEAEHIAEWEAALNGRDGLLKRFFILSGDDDELDGYENGTGVNWYQVNPSGDLAEAVALYAQIDIYAKACNAHHRSMKDTENWTLRRILHLYHPATVFLVINAEQFARLGEKKAPCLELCRKHDLCLVEPLPENRYLDHVSGKTYEVYVGERFPGSADDAATYGVLRLREV